MWYEGVGYVLFYKDKFNLVTDNVKRWKLNDDNSDILDDSLTILKDSVMYIISKKGNFSEI